MPRKIFESWIEKGAPLRRISTAIVAIVTVGVPLIDYATKSHHPGFAWYLVAALVIAMLWLLLENVRLHVRNSRRVEHATDASMQAAAVPTSALLVVTPVPGGSIGQLCETAPPASIGVVPGSIYLLIKVNVALAHENPSPVTILRVRADVQFESDLVQEVETSQFESLNLTDANASADWGPVSVAPGATLQITCHFIARALESQIDGEHPYQLPETSKIVRLTVSDSLNRVYSLAEPIFFPTARWEDPTPFQPG